MIEIQNIIILKVINIKKIINNFAVNVIYIDKIYIKQDYVTQIRYQWSDIELLEEEIWFYYLCYPIVSLASNSNEN